MCINDISANSSGIKTLVSEINSKHGDDTAVGIVADVTKNGEVRDLVKETAEKLGPLTCMVANAGRFFSFHRRTVFYLWSRPLGGKGPVGLLTVVFRSCTRQALSRGHGGRSSVFVRCQCDGSVELLYGGC